MECDDSGGGCFFEWSKEVGNERVPYEQKAEEMMDV